MYHYKESGLPNVWLANGLRMRATERGQAVAVMDVEGLHRAIGRGLAHKGHLTGAEFRFLRKELDFSQARLASLLGASEESVSLWERRGRVPKGAARLMQALYLEATQGSVKIKELVEMLADLDRAQQDRMVFSESETGWSESPEGPCRKMG